MNYEFRAILFITKTTDFVKKSMLKSPIDS